MASFVQRSGAQLILDGKPFRVAGGNNYYLGFVDKPIANAVLDLAASLKMNVLRISAFNENPAGDVRFHYFDPQTNWPTIQDGPNGLDRLDRAVYLAGQRNIRLILTLANNWDAFGGMPAYTNWFGLAAKDQFYTDGRCRAAYWQWAEQLITRHNPYTGRAYRDEPAILAWELANEPECALKDGVEIMLSWIWEMSSLIKGKDPNHLVAIGDQGYFRRAKARGNHLYNGSHGVSCEEFLGVGPIDFGTFHLYEPMANGAPLYTFGSTWIREHVEAGARANKPMLLEEYGARIGSDGIVDANHRARLYEGWLQTVRDSNAMGALVWMVGLPVQSGQPYDLDPYVVNDGPEVDVIRRFATY